MPRARASREIYLRSSLARLLPIDLQLFYCFVPVFNSNRRTIALLLCSFCSHRCTYVYAYTKGDFRLLIFSRHDSHCVREAALNLSILIGTQFALIVNNDCFFRLFNFCVFCLRDNLFCRESNT